MMKKILCIISAVFCIFLTACGDNNGGENVSKQGGIVMYEQISTEEAKRIMDSGEDIIILDVREKSEFCEGHIPGAILIPYTEIEAEAERVISDKNKQILVYCRSGRRSKIASESLVKLGYTKVKEFGGIIDWQYEVEK